MNMYTHQQHLPRLPLQSLDQTGNKLLEWSSVFLSEKEGIHTKDDLEAFCSPEGVGPLLQEHLEELNNQPEIRNWLEPLWAESYLGNPAALPLGGNVAFVIEKNPAMKNVSLPGFLTSLISTLYDFSDLIVSESLDIDYQGKTPLCMTQYNTLLSTTRIPGASQDSYLTEPGSGHVIVMYRGHYYQVEVLDTAKNRISTSKLLQQINRIVTNTSSINPLAVGSLTTLPRRKWAQVRKHLMDLSPENANGLHQIESALAVFEIDEKHHENHAQMFKDVLVGPSWNRWYDKSLQFILSAGSDIGINYEHSGVDGTTLGHMVAYLFQHQQPCDDLIDDKEVMPTNEITFELDDFLKTEIQIAVEESQGDREQLSLQVLPYTSFGKDFIKTLGVSPDSFVQMAIQLAQKKVFNQVFNVYESVMTKQFQGGRTETMRPVTPESLSFVENPTLSRLRAASEKHVQRINECKNGQGIDRHLYGLKKMHEKLFPEAPMPAVFSSPGYLAITTNTFSTSTSSAFGMRYAGYGPSVTNGFAVRYLIFKDRLHFVLSAQLHRKNDLLRLKGSLVESLDEMARLMAE